MDQSTRASSVWGVQSSSGSDQAIAEGDLRYLRIERKADCADAPVQTGRPQFRSEHKPLDGNSKLLQ
jgi:hypothetical protein